MKVLVTNDDGYKSIGLKLLIDKIKKYFDEIIVIAPKSQKSATSHAIILKGNIEFKQVDDIVSGVKTYYCDANPADCVSFARCVLKYPFDLVISGCNNGINLGYDIIYSGTVAGAKEGLIGNKKGLAISCKQNEFDSLESIDMVFDYIFSNKLFEKASLLNVNLVKNAKGVKITKMGKTFYGAYYEKLENDIYIPKMSDVSSYLDNDCETDWYAFLNNYISITPLTIDSTDYKMLKEYKN